MKMLYQPELKPQSLEIVMKLSVEIIEQLNIARINFENAKDWKNQLDIKDTRAEYVQRTKDAIKFKNVIQSAIMDEDLTPTQHQELLDSFNFINGSIWQRDQRTVVAYDVENKLRDLFTSQNNITDSEG